MSDRIRLSDDGTMDTVVVCRNCGQEARYNFAASDGQGDMDDDEHAYATFVEWAIEDFDSEHECEDE